MSEPSKTKDGQPVIIYHWAEEGCWTHGRIANEEWPSWWDKWGEYIGPVDIGVRQIGKDLELPESN